MRHRRRFAFLALALAACLGAPARADFYKLDGRFQCLARANAVCYDATPSPPGSGAKPATLDSPRPAAPPPPIVAALETTPVPPPVAAPPDPILAISARIKARAPAPGDLALLRRHVETGDKRALELLAWCALNGIGTPRDALSAYRLYGAAAADAVPHARENQRIIYEQALSSAQRQQLLLLEASGKGALP